MTRRSKYSADAVAALQVDGHSGELDGQLERPFPESSWSRPDRIELDEKHDLLRYRDLDDEEGLDIDGSVQPTRGDRLLERFVELADAPSERILAFARTFGVLGLCEHELPVSHHPDAIGSRLPEHGNAELVTFYRTRLGPSLFPPNPLSGCALVTDEDGHYVEPVSAWRRFAAEAKSVAAWVAERELGDFSADPIMHYRLGFLVRKTVVTWAEMGRVRLSVSHSDQGGDEDYFTNRLIPILAADGLFGALALRLLLAATGAYGIAICAACGGVFTPRTKPRRGERTWCTEPECRKKADAVRAADRRAGRSKTYRSRKHPNTASSK